MKQNTRLLKKMAGLVGLFWLASLLMVPGCEGKRKEARIAAGPKVGDVVDISGDDLEGKPLKLSDFRGKVVLLDFWATWCGPCREQFPNNRSLVHRYKERPFVLLGVNADARPDFPKKLEVAELVTWRSFWDGPSSAGPILSRWQIYGLPTISLIDDKGVLRYHMIHPGQVEGYVEKLVSEAESRGQAK